MVEKSQSILLTSPFTEVNLIQKEAMNQKKAKRLVSLLRIWWLKSKRKQIRRWCILLYHCNQENQNLLFKSLTRTKLISSDCKRKSI